MTASGIGTTIAAAARRSDVRVALLYFLFACLWIVLTDRLLVLTPNDRDLLILISTVKGIAFAGTTAILLYALLRSRRHLERTGIDASIGSGSRVLFAVCLAAVLGVPLIGLGVVGLYAPQVKHAAWDDLDSIVELKAGQIESWLQERHSDADELAISVGFLDSFKKWRATGDPHARTTFQDRLDVMRRLHSDEIEVLDAEGRWIDGDDDRPDTLDAVRQQLLPDAQRSGNPQVSDMYRDPAGKIRLDFVVPLSSGKIEPLRPEGFVVLRAPIEGFLVPLLKTWPTASASSEFVLVRRAGDQVLVLNELRHRSGSALSYRLPADAPDLPAAIGTRARQQTGPQHRGRRLSRHSGPRVGASGARHVVGAGRQGGSRRGAGAIPRPRVLGQPRRHRSGGRRDGRRTAAVARAAAGAPLRIDRPGGGSGPPAEAVLRHALRRHGDHVARNQALAARQRSSVRNAGLLERRASCAHLGGTHPSRRRRRRHRPVRAGAGRRHRRLCNREALHPQGRRLRRRRSRRQVRARPDRPYRRNRRDAARRDGAKACRGSARGAAEPAGTAGEDRQHGPRRDLRVPAAS